MKLLLGVNADVHVLNKLVMYMMEKNATARRPNVCKEAHMGIVTMELMILQIVILPALFPNRPVRGLT
jgi:hypothetical protein